MKLASPIQFTSPEVRDLSLAALGVSGRALTEMRTQADHGLAVGDPVIRDGDGDFLNAAADDTQVAATVVGVVSAVSGSDVTVTLSGLVTGLSGLAPGGIHYVADDGSLTADTEDCTNWVTPVLTAITSTSGYVNPQAPQSKALIPLAAISGISTDGALTSNSDAKLPTEKAVKTYVDAAVGDIEAGSVPLGVILLWPRADAGSIPEGFVEDDSEDDIGSFMFIRREDPDTTAPTVVSRTILADGETLEIVFDEPVKFGAGGNGGLTLTASGGAVTATYGSGADSDTLTYTLSRPVIVGETVTASYTQPGDGIEDAAGNDLASFTTQAVTNNSEESGAFTPHAAAFDGTNDYLARSTGLAGLADGKKVTFSCIAWFADGSDDAEQVIFAQGLAEGTSTTFTVSRTATNKLFVFGRDTAGVACLSITGSVDITHSSGPVHVCVAIDLAQASVNSKLWVNGVNDTGRTVTTFIVDSVMKLAIDGATPKVRVGSATGATSKFSGALKELWLDDVFHPHPEDFATDSTPLDIGATGDGPTGSAPALYLSRNGSGNAWAVDSSGNGNNFTVVGALD